MNKAQKFVVKIVFMGTIIVIIGIMLNTKKGAEIQKMLKDKAIHSVENAKAAIQDKSDAVNAAASQAAKKACKAIKKIDEKTENGKDELKKVYSDAKHDISKTLKKISNNLDKS